MLLFYNGWPDLFYSAYKVFENELRRALKNGENVGPVSVIFERSNPRSSRPDSLIVEYVIGGEARTRDFTNKSGG